MADLDEFSAKGKRGRGSQLKGHRGENEVVAMLQPWWRQFEPEEQFVRTPKSGGWAVARVRGAFRAAGDVMTTSKVFPFCIEVKRREAWKLGSFVAGRRSPIWGWWKQGINAAIEEGAQPVLFFRKSRQKWWMLLPREYAKLHIDIRPDIYWPGEPAFGHARRVVDYGGVVPNGYLAESFFAKVHPSQLPMQRFP